MKITAVVRPTTADLGPDAPHGVYRQQDAPRPDEHPMSSVFYFRSLPGEWPQVGEVDGVTWTRESVDHPWTRT